MRRQCPACAREIRRDNNLQRARETANQFQCLDCGEIVDANVLQVDVACGVVHCGCEGKR